VRGRSLPKVCLPIELAAYLPACLPVRLSACLMCMPICPPAWQSVSQSTASQPASPHVWTPARQQLVGSASPMSTCPHSACPPHAAGRMALLPWKASTACPPHAAGRMALLPWKASAAWLCRLTDIHSHSGCAGSTPALPVA